MSDEQHEPEGVQHDDASEHGKDDESLAEEATNAAQAPEPSEEAEAHWGP